MDRPAPKHVRLIFSADLHGSVEQYNALANVVVEKNADVLLLGGDLFPKGGDKDPLVQLTFWKSIVVPILKELKKAKPHVSIFVIMGNADSSYNMSSMKALGQAEELYTMLNTELVQIPNSDFYLFGYCYIPVSPHRRKDWEKFDTVDGGVTVKRVFKTDGYLTSSGKMVDVKLKPEVSEKDCIQLDLESVWNKQTIPPERTIWMVHTPPYNTCMDTLASGSHVGSVAVHKQIMRSQPLITLHGHIHETVDINKGKYMEKLGTTCSYAAGNKWKHDVAYILVSTAEPHAGLRLKGASQSAQAKAP